MALIDTHSLIEEMIASGIKKEQAVILTKAINQSNDNLITKSDLNLAISDLRHDLETRIDKIDNNMNWLKGLGLLGIGLLIKVAFFSNL